MAQPQRKNLLINKRFQLSMLLYANILAFLVVGIFTFGVYVFMTRLNAFVTSLGGENSQMLLNYLAVQERSLMAIFAFISVCAFFIICASSMVLSHRIAGPLYRLNTHLNLVADYKTIGDVKFRDKDFFLELAESCNRALARFR